MNFCGKALARLVVVGRRQGGAGGHGQQQQSDDTHLSSVSHLRSRSGALRSRRHRFILAPGLFLFQRHPRRPQLFPFSAVRLRRLRRSVQPTPKTTRPVDGIRNGHSCKNCCYIVCATLLMYNAIDFASSLIKGEHWGCENFPYFSSSIATTQTKNSWLFCFYHSSNCTKFMAIIWF